MIYDVPFRHQQALDPSALTNVLTTLHAITKGVEDCRNAGVDPNSDPAISLLIRHMGRIASNQASESVLRSACERRIEELRRFPALLALSIRGVEYDQAAKERFHVDGRKAMRSLARALALAEGSYEVSSHPGDISISGDVVLQSADLTVSLSVGPLHEGHEVRYTARRGPAARDRLRYAAIHELLKPERFAARLRRELQLEPAPVASPEPAQILLPA
ncbi:hypothetical protein [Sphingomonas lacusdianchii]|uniref:hypothetical protein n=1 Tax=Sphingomonas lacusdianchii TaxID=2917992 RepID=UPI001F58DD69|nr:hypothetical protein [Sphingomonas sp. JXJ CY 53]